MRSYQSEREEFIARVSREGLPLHVAQTLLRQATTIHRLAELACSSEAADRDRIPCPATRNYSEAKRARSTATDNHVCLCDAIRAVPNGWRVLTEGDPRGYTLKVIPPSYADRNAGRDRFNLDAIGVPARPSGLRF